MGNIVAIQSRLLLSFYLILPFSVLVVAVDYLYLNQFVRNSLPSDPHYLPFFAMFFHLPHIVASSIILLDKEYLNFYKKPLLIGLPLIALSIFIVPEFIGLLNAILLYGFVTIIHVVGQQIGISRMLLGPVSIKDFNLWKYLSLLIWVYVYYLLLRSQVDLPIVITDPILYTVIGVFVLSSYYAARMYLYSSSTIGRYHLISTHILLLVTFLFVIYRYSFFAFLCPRVIHDCTAFAFYMTHDQNRFSGKKSNFVFKLLAFSGIPIFILCPLIAVLLTSFLQYSTIYVGTYVLTFLTLTHYMTEAITWKRSGLHRHYVKIN